MFRTKGPAKSTVCVYYSSSSSLYNACSTSHEQTIARQRSEFASQTWICLSLAASNRHFSQFKKFGSIMTNFFSLQLRVKCIDGHAALHSSR